MRMLLGFGLRLVLLAAIYLVLFSAAYGIAFALLGVQVPPSPDVSSGNDSGGILPLAAVALLNSFALAVMIVRSHWSGHRLAFAVAFVMYGVMTFMSQIETAVFPAVASRLSPGMLPALFIAGALLAIPFAPLSVLVMGKWHPKGEVLEPNHRLEMPAGDWVWRLTLAGVLYVALYFAFGYFVAWRNPAVTAYYGGSDPGSFLAQLVNVARDTPWMYPFQFLRGILWVLIALPVLRMAKGGALETGAIIGLQFAVLMNSAHLLPNPLMPDAVRWAHLLETAPSNFILGLLVAAIFHWRAKPGTMFSRPAPILR